MGSIIFESLLYYGGQWGRGISLSCTIDATLISVGPLYSHISLQFWTRGPFQRLCFRSEVNSDCSPEEKEALSREIVICKEEEREEGGARL